jgi:hypothetical protein
MRTGPSYGAGSIFSRPVDRAFADELRRVTRHRKEALVVDIDRLARPRSSPILSSPLLRQRMKQNWLTRSALGCGSLASVSLVETLLTECRCFCSIRALSPCLILDSCFEGTMGKQSSPEQSNVRIGIWTLA